MQQFRTLVACIGLVAAVASCQHVEPWQRATLAKSEMSFEPNELQGKLRNQTYFSKEAASGGHATAGAGCGCN